MAERNPGLSAHKEQSEGGDRLIKVFIYLGAVCALLVVFFAGRIHSTSTRFGFPAIPYAPRSVRETGLSLTWTLL
jgi:hypothetical protein